MTEIDPLAHPWAEDQVAAMHRLRDWAVTFMELNHHLSSWMALPVSDANALGQVIWAEVADAPLSPASLARRIGMTSGATSILLDRLETAGHVERHRESADRRRITLRATATARAESQRFLAFAGTEIAATVQETPDEDLEAVVRFLDRMTAAATAANGRLVQRATAGR